MNSRSKTAWIWITALLWALLMVPAAAQAALEIDPNLRLQFAGSGEVRAIARRPGGGLVVAGEFHSVNNIPISNIARFDAAGNLDTHWKPNPDGEVYALHVDANDITYIAGLYDNVGGLPRPGPAKVLSDGTVAAWAPQASVVQGIDVDSAGRIYIGGTFTQVNGQAYSKLARFDAQGVLDTTWKPTVTGSVRRLAVSGSGVIVAGQFSSINTTPRSNIARIEATGSGVLDPLFNAAVNLSVIDMIVTDAGHIYVSGAFTLVNGVTRRTLARLHASDGTLDNDFDPELSSGQIDGIAIDGASGHVYAAGLVGVTSGQQRIARFLTSTGAFDTSWVFSNPGRPISNVGVLGAGEVWVGGSFQNFDYLPRLGLARILPGAQLGAPVDLGGDNMDSEVRVNVIARQRNGGQIVAGFFVTADGHPRPNVFRLLPGGTIDPDWKVHPYGGMVRDVAIGADDSVYLAGDFTHINGQADHAYLVRVSATGPALVDPDWKPSPAQFITLIKRHENSLFIHGATLAQVGGQVRSRIARISAHGTGALDPQWNLTANTSGIRALAVHDDTLFIGYEGTRGARKFSAEGSAIEDLSWNPNLGSASSTKTIQAIHADARGVLLSGKLDANGGTPTWGSARYSLSTGATDSGWSRPFAFIRLQPGTHGEYYLMSSSTIRTVSAATGSDTAGPSGDIAASSAFALSMAANGSLLLGGRRTFLLSPIQGDTMVIALKSDYIFSSDFSSSH